MIDGDQTMPAVAMSNMSESNGGFVVAWQSVEIAEPYGIVYRIYTRRFDSSGSPMSESRVMNSYDQEPQTNPTVAVSPEGNFVVAWEHFEYPMPSGTPDIHADVFLESSDEYVGEFLACSSTSRGGEQPTAAMDAEGDFVLAWHRQDFGDNLDKLEIVARLFKAPAEPTTQDFRVNDIVAGPSGGFDDREPTVAMSEKGNFVVAWQTQDTILTPYPDGEPGFAIFAAAL